MSDHGERRLILVVEGLIIRPVPRDDGPGLDAAVDRFRCARIPPPGPKEYFQAGRMRFLPYNVYTNMPFNVEMFHLLAMEVMGDWWWGASPGNFWWRSSGRPRQY